MRIGTVSQDSYLHHISYMGIHFSIRQKIACECGSVLTVRFVRKSIIFSQTENGTFSTFKWDLDSALDLIIAFSCEDSVEKRKELLSSSRPKKKRRNQSRMMRMFSIKSFPHTTGRQMNSRSRATRCLSEDLKLASHSPHFLKEGVQTASSLLLKSGLKRKGNGSLLLLKHT